MLVNISSRRHKLSSTVLHLLIKTLGICGHSKVAILCSSKIKTHPSLESKALVSFKIVPPFSSSSICLCISQSDSNKSKKSKLVRLHYQLQCTPLFHFSLLRNNGRLCCFNLNEINSSSYGQNYQSLSLSPALFPSLCAFLIFFHFL